MTSPEKTPDQLPRVLTIAGSDSGGAAGLQADLKTFSAVGVYGMSAVTAVTVQNSLEVRSVHPLPIDLVLDQIRAVLDDYGADAVKTGFIGRVDLIQAVAELLSTYRPANIVIDPVLVNHHGKEMFPADVAAAYIKYLFPLADLVTPNLSEAELLSRVNIRIFSDVEKAGDIISRSGSRNVLIKGCREDDEMIDLLVDQGFYTQFRSPRLSTENTHGSGDTLSAAISAWLALGLPLFEAVARAGQFTHAAIERAIDWKMGRGHGPVGQRKLQLRQE